MVIKFLLYKLLLCYLTNEKKHALRFISEMAENSIFLIWRSRSLLGYVTSMIDRKKISISNEDAFDACLISLSGFYAILHKYHDNKIYIDYKKMFRIFIKTLFAHMSMPNSGVYIDDALQIFSDLDKDLLHSTFDSVLTAAR